MVKESQERLKCGDEVTYIANKYTDPQLLTFVETMKNGINRYFSSQFPTLEYHLEHDNNHIHPYDESYQEEIQEKYFAFKGGDTNKQRAYEILLTNRGIHV